MGLFRQRRPRGFRHEYMFAEKRKDMLKEVEERAKRELGASHDKKPADRAERIRGVFINSTRYARRRRERRLAGGFILSTGIVLLLIVLLILIWKFLLYI